MNWEQKLQALQALCDVSLKMRKPGDWYVSSNMSIAGDGFLRSNYGNGQTPESAVNNHWENYTTLLSPESYIAVNQTFGPRKQVRWNGFMWEDVPCNNEHPHLLEAKK